MNQVKQINYIQNSLENIGKFIVEVIKFSGIFDYQVSLSKPGSYPPKFLGLDIMFDEQFKPWLLEIERYPGVGGVFPETKRINNSFKQDYFNLIIQPSSSLLSQSFLGLTS